MSKAKRIFIVSDFKDYSPKAIRVERRHWPKGFIRLGHDVQCLSYNTMLRRFSLFHSKKLARFFSSKKVDALIYEQIKHYHPHIVFIHCMGDLNEKTVSCMRQAAPQAVFVGRDNDMFPERDTVRIAAARRMDIVIATNAGKFLETYKKAGVPLCAFIPNPCDPDIQRAYEVDNMWKSDVIFTGTAKHSRLAEGLDRYELLTRLLKKNNVNTKLYGCFGSPTIDGIETFYAISGAKIGLNINTVNNIKLCHSDRLVNYISCGTLALSRRVPDTDLLFKDGVHAKYFDTADEFFELVDWYLKHDQEREKIARAGMEKAHKEFNCTKIAEHVLGLIETGACDAPWATIL